MKRILVLLAVLSLSSPVCAETVDNTADPRQLSTIDLPRGRVCASDVSENGRQAFTICDAKSKDDGETPSGPAKLYIHDITDLRQPKLVNQTDLNEMAGYRVVARNGILFYQQTVGKGVALVDVRNIQQPKPAGHIDAGYNQGFKVSNDGRYLGVKSAGNKLTYYDIGHPSKPIPVSPTLAEDGVAKGDGIWSNADSMDIKSIEADSLRDRRDGRALVTDKENPLLLHIYALKDNQQPERLATFSPGPRSMWTHIIPHQQAVIIENQKDETIYQLKIMQTVDAVFTPAYLKSLHAEMQVRWAPCQSPSSTLPVDCYRLSESLAELRDAGIEKLLTEQPAGLTHGERVLLLNDYGYWLSRPYTGNQETNLEKAETVLKKVVELSPKRASAWLNLGDVYRDQIPLATTDTAKAKLWNDAIASYKRYKDLSGKDAVGAAKLTSFDLPRALKSSETVCAYIAEAFNKGKMEQITSASGTAEVNGKTIGFTADWSGGTCSTKQIWAAGCNWMSCFDNEDRLKGLYVADGGFGGSVMIVPFKGKSYTAVEGPGEVVDPNTGPVCNLTERYEAKLVENKHPALCERFFKGELKQNIPWVPLKDKEIKPADIDLARAAYAHFGEAAEVNFDGKSKVRVGHFNMASGAGCGCGHSGIALIGAAYIVSQATEPNASLIELQGKWWRCGNADAGLIQDNGTTYVEAWGEDLDGKGAKPRALLQLVKGSFEPVCRVEQIKTVVPSKH